MVIYIYGNIKMIRSNIQRNIRLIVVVYVKFNPFMLGVLDKCCMDL